MQRTPTLSDADMTLFERKTRYVRQYFTFGVKSSRDFLLYLSAPGVYDSPEVDVELQTIPGKNGDLVRENARQGERRYKNIDVIYDAFFFDAVAPRTATVKSWLLSRVGYQVLHDTYDPDFFRMGLCREVITFESKSSKGVSMKLTFHCQPQRWSVDGQRKIRLDKGGVLRNPFAFPSKPLIRVYGSGEGKVFVGDAVVNILQNSGYIDLNCETHNAYDAAGFCNGCIKSDDFPSLKPGRNSISWSGNITALEITPRWWTL